METLIKIQGELKAPKNQFNKFGNYKYRSCEDILEAAKPLCVNNGALLTISDEIIERSGFNFVQATVDFQHGEFRHIVTACAKHPVNQKGMSDSQMTGSASSYARKYALNGMFCIDDTKDNDTNESLTERIKRCTSKSDLADIFNNHKHLHSDAPFMKLMNDQKSKVK
jgi:hypothetical protein